MDTFCTRFTPAEGGARLAMATSDKNILVVEYASFIATRLVHEQAYKIRGTLSSGFQRTVYVTRLGNVRSVSYELNIMTDLSVTAGETHRDDWRDELEEKQVLVCTSSVLKQILEERVLAIMNINVLIIDSCHLIWRDENLQCIMKLYKECDEPKRPRILALTYPLFTARKSDDVTNTATPNDPETSDVIDKDTEPTSGDVTEVPIESDSKDFIVKAIGQENSDMKVIELANSDDKAIKTASNIVMDTANESVITDIAKDCVSAVSDISDRAIKASGDVISIEPQTNDVIVTGNVPEIGDSKDRAADPASSIVISVKRSDRDVIPIETLSSKGLTALASSEVNVKAVETAIDDVTGIGTISKVTMKDKLEATAVSDVTVVITDEGTSIVAKNDKNEDDKSDIKIIKSVGKHSSKENEDIKLNIDDIESKSAKIDADIDVKENLDDYDMYQKLEWKIEEFEKSFCCDFDLAEDIDGGKRLTGSMTKPKEIIIEFGETPIPSNQTESYADICNFMRSTVQNALEFINEHRYDPREIYGEDLYEEFKDIPDPTVEPKLIFKQFLYILDQLGPYAADKAAFSLLIKLEKLKIKVPYERHFLLLCLCMSVLVKVRGYAETVFSKVQCDWERIKIFSTPKVLRLAEILLKFQPPEIQAIRAENKSKLLSDLDKCDFGTLGNKIEDKLNTIIGNLSDLDACSSEKSEFDQTLTQIYDPIDFKEKTSDSANETVETAEKTNKSLEVSVISDDKCSSDSVKTSDSVNKIESEKTSESVKISDDVKKMESVGNSANNMEKIENTALKGDGKMVGFTRRSGGRNRGRGRPQRGPPARLQQFQLNPDALCGIVFTREALMAKILFMLIVDMSRSLPRLSYLCAQYCALESSADPSTEQKECQRQGKKQEEVLKKFRMHECNLLLATSALEEGIDLPRCNLVLRWDIPTSYRSYGLSRGRARAVRSCCAVLTQEACPLPPLAIYRELDQIISRKCGCSLQDEPPESEEVIADHYTLAVKPYTSNESNEKDLTAKRLTESDNTTKSGKEKSVMRKDDDVLDVKKSIFEDKRKENEAIELGLNESQRNELNKSKIKEIKSVLQGDCKNEDIQFDANESDKNKLKDSNKNEVESQKSLNSEKSIMKSDELLNINKSNKNQLNNQLSKLTICDNKCSKNLIETKSEVKCNDLNNEINKLRYNIEDMNLKSEVKDIESKSSIGIRNLNKEEDGVSANLDRSCNKCDSENKSVSVKCKCVQSDVNKSVEKKSAEKDIASVDLSTAIALINRYCGKLPSDTFTRLTPQWWVEEVQLPLPGTSETRSAYICTLRLPLNCPVKYNIVGHPMPSRVLARRMVALQACRILHKSGELDNHLMPIGKENFKAAELDTQPYCNATEASDANDPARPGTTKRRQYYFKRTAWAFTDCQPIVDKTDSEISTGTATIDTKTLPTTDKKIASGEKHKLVLETKEEGIQKPIPVSEENLEPTPETALKGTKRNMLYAIVSRLWCALPERYNTRGRRLHAPQHASQAIGILMARENADDLQIPAFPVYTRSGEVRVSVEYVPDADVRMSPRRGRLVRRFMRFVFSDVLRVRRRGMKLQTDSVSHNNYYIVPTVKAMKEDGTTKVDIDWAFLELIYQHTEEKKLSEVEKPVRLREEDGPEPVEKQGKKQKDVKSKVTNNPLLKPGETFVFDAEKYKEAVVTPWYRNQDQPQFFLVAEICWNLTPESAFPSTTHTSFREYYRSKYGAHLTQPSQPLLDVDHTSARLNLLTPRYVNRKGVALPVSSERTRRNKRDRLDQKQILVPELCRLHPFAAPLWFATVVLPCVLYRINALLIADEIRRAVAIDVGLGVPKIDETTCPGFKWPALDFGWSLSEVLSADSEKSDKKMEDEKPIKDDHEVSNWDRDIEEIKELPDGEVSELPKEKTINEILQEKENEGGFEIGMWSNDMALSIPETSEYDELMEPLPPNLTFCTSASGGTNWCDVITKPKPAVNNSRTFAMAESDCSYMSSDFDTDDSDLNSESDDDTESSGFWSKANMGVRIEYKTAHEAEAVDLERKKVNPAPQPDEEELDLDKKIHYQCMRDGEAPREYIEKFQKAVANHEKDILNDGNYITKDKPITAMLPETKDHRPHQLLTIDNKLLTELFPYGTEEFQIVDGQITLESIEKNKRVLLNKLKNSLKNDEIKSLNCFSMKDIDIDCKSYVNEKVANVGFDSKESYVEKINKWESVREFKPYYQEGRSEGKEFDFDYQPPLERHPGPSPSVILQALTMSNANDGINLERLETIGDSFLKFAITAYLYCAHPTVHEGKLSHMRSKQVSNLNLYRLGRGRRLGARMIASKFEPHDNWLPPCHKAPHTHTPAKGDYPEPPTHCHDGPVDNTGCFIPYNLITQHSIPDKSIADCVEALIGAYLLECGPRGALLFMSWLGIVVLPSHHAPLSDDHPYVKNGHHNIDAKPQKPSPRKPDPQVISDSDSDSDSDEEEEDEAQPREEDAALAHDWGWPGRPVGSLRPYKNEQGQWMQPIFGELRAPPSPLLRYIEDPEGELEQMLSGYDALENTLQYRFRDRSLLLQALTHASHQRNRLTDCYQRLEFLGDAVLDYLITRHLYEDPRRHSPGALTDLRSALVNNTIFATLAARHGLHKYFRHMSPGLNEVLTKYVKIQEENGHSISEEHYLIQEDELEQAEDVEVPKALGDLFESIAGAIFLDSGMSLGAVWRSYVLLMGAELEAFSAAAPKSPVRELLEAEPDTAKFGKPERLADGRRVRVCVEVFGRGAFKGVGRNYRIAKGTAARCALRHLRETRR